MAPSLALREAERTFERLHAQHPDAHCELDHRSAFQLVVATVLSAQTTDVNVNKATPTLFARFPTPAALAAADPAEVERIIGSLGFFRMKTKSIVGLAKKLVEEHGGAVPRTMAELVKLPGVGRKTANVVLGVAFAAPEGVVVDTHVQRISQRLGWTKNVDPITIEQDLMRLFPRKDWDMISHVLIFHGRRVCTAMRPACAACTVNDVCPSAFKAEKVGRKAIRLRVIAPAARIAPAKASKKAGVAVAVAKKAKVVARKTATAATKAVAKTARGRAKKLG
jgi:endonuclease-3